MNEEEKTVSIYDLTLIAGDVEDLSIIVEELTTDYFGAFDMTTKDGQRRFLWDFSRARAKANAALCLAISAKDALQKLGASR